jgi:hypothetical protein
VTIEENGTVSVSNSIGIDFTGHLNVIDDNDGTVTIDPTHNHDSRYYTQSEVRSWVNNNADVPNSDYANTVGTVNDNGHTLYLQNSSPNNPSSGDIWIDTS